MHPTAEWLRAAAEEASATPPPHQEQRGRPGSARELANFEANLARVRPRAGPSSVEAGSQRLKFAAILFQDLSEDWGTGTC